MYVHQQAEGIPGYQQIHQTFPAREDVNPQNGNASWPAGPSTYPDYAQQYPAEPGLGYNRLPIQGYPEGPYGQLPMYELPPNTSSFTDAPTYGYPAPDAALGNYPPQFGSPLSPPGWTSGPGATPSMPLGYQDPSAYAGPQGQYPGQSNYG